ncbi:MAG TPA: hypothetical protein PLN21_13650 [Gemmatales bacterium]|nr:hypothetical protein [Gemmatales bacterium]
MDVDPFDQEDKDKLPERLQRLAGSLFQSPLSGLFTMIEPGSGSFAASYRRVAAYRGLQSVILQL